MTPRWKPIPVFCAFAYGLFVGLVVLMVLLFLLARLTTWAGAESTTVDRFLAVGSPFCCLGVVAVGIAFARSVLKEQKAEWLAAKGRCKQCGYHFTGIWESVEQCPECGTHFKSTHRD